MKRHQLETAQQVVDDDDDKEVKNHETKKVDYSATQIHKLLACRNSRYHTIPKIVSCIYNP
jgi:hypothetical protein